MRYPPALIAVAILCTVLMSRSPALAEEAHAAIQIPVEERQIVQERMALAQSLPQEFLAFALKNYQRQIRDYTCLFVKQELVQGKLTKEQHIEVKFREGPFAVFMQWVKNPSLVDHVLYVKGRHGDKALVKPAGVLGWFVPTHVKRGVNSPDSAKVSRRRLDQFGFGNALDLIHETNTRAEKAGDLKLTYKGEGQIDDRKTFVLERKLPDKPEYPDQKLVVHVDQEWLVPVATYCYDAHNRLLGKYEYRDVKLNVGLSWKEFTAEANDL
ncbi:MAG: DUF1571 domain-containing protein [Phycisphaerae bacterium]|nr:DUF1571 domain-containing protein [Phycisphaerae bacterium]